MMSPTDVKTWAEIAEIAFKIGALLLAAGWTVCGVYMFSQREKAAADLRKVELEARQLERAARQIAVLRTEITASAHRSVDMRGYFILADVCLTNAGSYETRIKWLDQPPAFTIRHTTFGVMGEPLFGTPPIEMRVRQARDPSLEAPSHVVRAGATEHLVFAARVDAPGVYLLSFRGALAAGDKAVSVNAGTAPENPVSWTAQRYVLVGAPTDPA
jgi:hypothetical protein